MENYHPINWEEISVLGRARGQGKLLLKESLHIQMTHAEEHFNRDRGCTAEEHFNWDRGWTAEEQFNRDRGWRSQFAGLH